VLRRARHIAALAIVSIAACGRTLTLDEPKPADKADASLPDAAEPGEEAGATADASTPDVSAKKGEGASCVTSAECLSDRCGHLGSASVCVSVCGTQGERCVSASCCVEYVCDSTARCER
jgi:hypothetical protein